MTYIPDNFDVYGCNDGSCPMCFPNNQFEDEE